MTAEASLSGRVAVVTGGARGMGSAIVRHLVDDGAHVVIADVLEDEGRALAAELGPGASFTPLDVTDAAEWQDVIAHAESEHGPVDVLVNNAGILRGTALATATSETYQSIVAVNQLGVFLGMQAVSKVMMPRRSGSIINISSIDGMIAMPLMSAYVATKWAVRGMTKVAALELGPHGIRCNSVHPGYIDTPMLTRGGRLDDATLAGLAAGVPSRRLGTPEDIAAVCSFLASDASSYCNGSEIAVDGGLLAGWDTRD